jgi:hypothetical protein
VGCFAPRGFNHDTRCVNERNGSPAHPCRCVGRRSLEAFLLPCIEQALTDAHHGVVARALGCLAQLCGSRGDDGDVLMQVCAPPCARWTVSSTREGIVGAVWGREWSSTRMSGARGAHAASASQPLEVVRTLVGEEKCSPSPVPCTRGSLLATFDALHSAAFAVPRAAPRRAARVRAGVPAAVPPLVHRAHRYTAVEELRIVTFGFGTGRQKTPLERWTNPKHSRRTCTCEYGLQSC